MELLQLKPSQLGAFLLDMWENSPEEAVMITGKTGCGKSAITEGAARKLYGGDGYVDIRLAGKEPTDLIGAMVPISFEPSEKKKATKTSKAGAQNDAQLELPQLATRSVLTPGITTFFPPADMPYENVPGFQEKGVLGLDEFHQAPPAVLNLAYGLVYDRMAGQNHLRKGWRLVAMGNLRSEKTYQEELPEPLRGRFTHIELAENLEDYIEHYMLENPTEMIIPGFLKFNPALLHSADPEGTGGFPCPRSWSRSGEYLKTGGEFMPYKVAGSIGEKAWSQLAAFIAIMTDENQKMPASEAIKKPENLNVSPNNPGLAWAHAVRISGYVREQVTSGNDKAFFDGMRFFIHKIWKQNIEVGRLGLRMMRESLGDKGTKLAAQDHKLLTEYLAFYGDASMIGKTN